MSKTNTNELIKKILQNFETTGKLDYDLCEKMMKILLEKKYGRTEYITSSEYENEIMAVSVLLALKEYNSAYILVRWIGQLNRIFDSQ